MTAGYDAALYHIPHQVWLQNDKIIFGLSNVHSRFGIISFFSYIGANLWQGNYYDGLSYLQGIFFLIFFSFLFFLVSHREKFLEGIVMSTILSLPIWFRYIYPSYGLVDASYGFLFYISFILGIYLIFKKNNFYDHFYLSVFLLLSIFSFLLKPSGIFLAPFNFVVLLILLNQNKVKLKILIKLSFFPLAIFVFWILKNFINTGCLIYPASLTCFNVSWSNIHLVNEINFSITNFAWRYFELFELKYLYLFIKNYFYLFLISMILILLFFNLVKYKKNNLLLFLLIILNCILYYSPSLKGFSYFSEHNPREIIIEIITKEALTIGLVSLISALIAKFYIFKNFNIRIFSNKIRFMPFLFILLFFIIWFVKAPLPRLAYGYFILLSASLFIILLNKDELVQLGRSDKTKFLIKFVMYFVIILFFIIQPVYKTYNQNLSLTTNLSYNYKKNPDNLKFLKRSGYGFEPIKSPFCWNFYGCYPREDDSVNNDVKLNYYKYNYKKFIRYN